MIKKRKTKAQREAERYEKKRHAWESFRIRLENLHSLVDALKLVAESPSPNSPGRTYYSNLAFFMSGFTVPAGSDFEEKTLYLQLIRRAHALGELEVGALQKVEAALQQAINSQAPFR